jgi:hypothetical protein
VVGGDEVGGADRWKQGLGLVWLGVGRGRTSSSQLPVQTSSGTIREFSFSVATTTIIATWAFGHQTLDIAKHAEDARILLCIGGSEEGMEEGEAAHGCRDTDTVRQIEKMVELWLLPSVFS